MAAYFAKRQPIGDVWTSAGLASIYAQVRKVFPVSIVLTEALIVAGNVVDPGVCVLSPRFTNNRLRTSVRMSYRE